MYKIIKGFDFCHGHRVFAQKAISKYSGNAHQDVNGAKFNNIAFLGTTRAELKKLPRTLIVVSFSSTTDDLTKCICDIADRTIYDPLFNYSVLSAIWSKTTKTSATHRY